MIDVAFTPGELGGGRVAVEECQVVVLDVLRATSTMVTALHAGAKEVVLFDSLDAARAARVGFESPVLLAGESRCLKPDDFDMGNSPREAVAERVGGATILLATTNGTRAAVCVRGAARLFAAGLVNAGATAGALLSDIDLRSTLLVCAGTNGKAALEDIVGAGAILFALMQATYRTDLAFTDNAWVAYHAFAGVRLRLAAALRLGAGGVNVIEAGLEEDIDHCARLDSMPIIVRIDGTSLRATRG